MKNGSRNVIFATARATRGIKRPNEANQVGGFVGFIKKVFGDLSWYEYLWYAMFFSAGALCFAFLEFELMLLFTVISFYIYLVADNLTARGLTIGLFVSILSGSVYTTLCVFNGVWGEVIANICIYIPLDVWAIFKWRNLKSENDNHEKTLAVTKMSFTEWWFYLSFWGVGTIALGMFLTTVLNQSTGYLNAACIFVYLAGQLSRNQGKREMWFFYFAGDIISIVMWIQIVTDDGWNTFPFFISTISSLSNSVIGFIKWQQLLSKNQKTTGHYLAHQRKRIVKIIRLRHRFKNLVWKKETDEHWQLRHKTKEEKSKCQK